MEEFTVCEVFNTEDKRLMTLSTEWQEDEVKIVILRSGMVPLTGQTTLTKLCDSTPAKTREESVKMFKNELTGKDKDILFSLNDSRLIWKKKIWKRGTIEVKSLDNVVFLGDFTLQWLKQCKSLQDSSKTLQKTTEILEKSTQQLVNQMKDMEQVKNAMEETLYKQFLLLLNSKKRKIRELEERLNNQSPTLNRSVYDVSTDDSDVELQESPNKRKKMKREREASPVASTSKRFSNSPLKPSPESDEEIVLRYDESQRPMSHLNITEEDPEDDLFSQ